ncbi:hypothetical protein ACFXGT_11830 [Streptomyces sp. NPDC059352]|uniref:hypothetical protein n=1 Tax=Streptomyces sp. NPDC059352 TaxID=3346810 RepID=UPI003674B91F
MTEKITPEELITPNHEYMMSNQRHGVLAPKIAGDRWQALQAVVSEMNRLSDLYYERAEAAEDMRLAAVAAHARAADSGKAVPAGMGTKVQDAKLAVDGTLAAFRSTLPRLVSARKAYDALFNDREFIAEYRETVAAEFLKRRESALKAFKELDTQIPALAELYRLLGEFTLDHLLSDSVAALTFNGEHLENGNVFTKYERSWAAPKLSEAVSQVRDFVVNDDPVLGGTLLAEDLGTVARALPELAEKRYDEWLEDLEVQAPMKMTNSNPWAL